MVKAPVLIPASHPLPLPVCPQKSTQDGSRGIYPAGEARTIKGSPATLISPPCSPTTNS